jgi:AraC-like DNA-binding protein
MQIKRTIIETDDLDAYPALERAMGWSSEKTQLSEGPGFYRFAMVTIGDLALWRYHASTQVYHSYETLKGTVDFVFFRESKGTVWCGHELPHNASLVHHPGNSYWAKTDAGTTLHGLFLLERQARAWELAPDEILHGKESTDSSILFGTDLDVDRLLNRIDSILDLSNDEIQKSHQNAVGIHDAVIANLHRFLDASLSAKDLEPGVRELPRRALFDSARNLIAARMDGPLTAADVAELLCVSQRVLELSFHDVLGIGPYRFILNQKLHAARRILMAGEGTVRQVCDRFGFVNAGRFANMYTQLFGQLPSSTLRGAALKSNLVPA